MQLVSHGIAHRRFEEDNLLGLKMIDHASQRRGG